MVGRRRRCLHCSKFVEVGALHLVHERYCDPSGGVAFSPPPKRPRIDLFGTAGLQENAIGPDAGQRPEDLCVKIAVEDAVPPWKPPSPALRTAEETAQEVKLWTTDASKEEVVEAMRRTVMFLGIRSGAKSMDRLIKLMQHPSFCSVAMKSGIPSYRAVIEDADRQLEDSLLSLRFQREQVFDAIEEGQATMWVRDPVEVVRRQIEQLTVDAEHNGVDKVKSLYMKCFKEVGDDGVRRYSHPLSTDVAADLEKRVRERVTNGCADGEDGVTGWKTGRDFVLLLQLYSDKTQQTLKASSQNHLPLHVAVVNTSLRMKERMICRGDSVVGYMPTKIRWNNLERKKWKTHLDDAVSGKGSRQSRLRILQESLRKCLEPLLSLTVCGFPVQDSVGRQLRCHPVLWSYVTDLPEGWDISSAVWHRCSRCFVKNKDLNRAVEYPKKKASQISKKYCALNQAVSSLDKNKAKDISDSMWARGVGPVTPYLLSLGNNFGVDLYNCLRYEVMHNIHLGLTRTMLECMSLRLRSPILRSREFITQKTGKPSSFKTIRTRVLAALNLSLELFDRQSPMIDFRVSHKSSEKTGKLNGLFMKDGLAAMLEARDYAQILQVMPFLGATCDRLCDELGTTTRMFVDYISLVYKMMRVREIAASSTAADIRNLKLRICQFTEDAHKLYKGYQKSDMALPKMHALLHAADDIEQAGLLAHYRADAYESSHKAVKTAYNSGSRRGDGGQGEALDKMARADFLRMASGKTERGARIRVVDGLAQIPRRRRGVRTRSKVEAVEKDSVHLSQPRIFIRAAEIYRVLEDSEESESYMQSIQGSSAPRDKELYELILDLGGPAAFRWFIRKLKLEPEDSVGRSNSGDVPGFPYPVLEKSVDNKAMLLTVARAGIGDAPQGTVKRELQRVVAAHSFYNSENPVQNFVMVQAGTPEATKEKLEASAKGKYACATVREVWIAKVLAFLTVRRKRRYGVGLLQAKSILEERALVMYLDVCKKRPDKVDEALGCIRLRWAQENDKAGMGNNMDSMRCVYGLPDAASIRGVVHVLRGDYGLGISNKYKHEGDRHWAETWFYLNKYKLERRGAKLFLEDGEDDDAV